MGAFCSMRWFQVMLLVGLCAAGVAQAEPLPFMIEVNNEPKTIGDIKPAFLVYRNEELPKVSVEYVMKRYVKLFENAASPDVKVDALNRINNLSAKYGLSSKKLTIDKVKQSEAVLDSYDKIVDSGVFYQRMDELLYQTAKATLFIGNREESIKRLKLLVGLYPRSALVDEARFRMAEAMFDIGEYADAAAEYKKIIAFSEDDAFHKLSKFKAGWALFKESRYDDAAKLAAETLDYYPPLRQADSVEVLDESEQEMAEDTLRLMAIVFSKQDNAGSIEALQKVLAHRDYAYLMYDALFRFYLSQDRYEESASVALAYAREYSDDFNAYRMALNAIRSYQEGEFDIREWQAKEDFVARFGVRSAYWQGLNAHQRERVRPHTLNYLAELAHLYYIRMQTASDMDDKANIDKHSARARDYYLELAETSPDSLENGRHVFLAAEARHLAQALPEAIALYERSAYRESLHGDAATAGYAAIRSYDRLKAEGQVWTAQLATQRVSSIEQFAEHFEPDARTPDLLNVLANERFDAQQWEPALATAQRVVAHTKAKPAVRYASALVVAHSLFELQRYGEAEQAYTTALSMAKETDRVALEERLAASIYRQAERAQDPLQQADLFLKVVDKVPGSGFVSEALYAASAQLLAAEQWPRAIATMNLFTTRFSDHEYRRDVDEKLVYAYQQNGDLIAAADQLVALSQVYETTDRASAALYQAAEYYELEGLAADAMGMYARFIEQYPGQFELVIEAYDKKIAYYDQYYPEQAADWRRKLVSYESERIAVTTPRARSLAAKARFALLDKSVDAFADIRLQLPLKQSLQRKKASLQSLVTELEQVAEYGVAEYSAAATHVIAGLYRQLARDLMDSERPPELTDLQQEQYDILLEEQAYPFEEQAMDLYRLNVARAPEGQYDEWVRKSFISLAEMNPTEYLREAKLPEMSHEPY